MTTPSLIPADTIIKRFSLMANRNHSSTADCEGGQSLKTDRSPLRRSLQRLIGSEVPYSSDWSSPHSRCRSTKHWIRQVYLEFLYILLAGLLLGVLLRHLPTIFVSKRTFPVWSSEGRLVGPPAISYPLVPSVVPSAVVWTTVTVIPVLDILLFQLRVRDIHDATVGIFGVGKAIILVLFISSILQHFIGGFRPHFLDVCAPDPNGHTSTGFGKVYFDINSCTTKDRAPLHYALQSFPSDRTAVAFAAAVFLALYINAKLKVFADYGSFFWKQILVLTPIVGASMIGGGLIVDKHNHIGDVLFGAWLGTVIAMLTYRSSYAAVLDYRYNHVPFAFERAQHRFQYTKESAEQVAKESIATQWWGKYDEEKAISSPSPQRPPTRFNLGIFDGANDHSNPNNTREPQLSPTALESLQQSLQEEEEARLGDVVPYEETLRAEIWKGKQRCSTTTSPQEEQPQIIQGLSPSLSYYLTKQLQSPPQPQLYQSSPPQLYQSSPPQLYHPKSAEPFIAENTAPSNAGGSSPIEGVPVFALNGILTKVNRLLKSKEPSWKIEEKKILNAGIQTQTNGNMPEKVRTCNGNGNGNNRRNGHQSIGIPDEGSSSQQQQQQQQQYHKSVNGKLASSIQIDSSKINTMRNNVDFPTEEEEGIFHMEIEEDPEILEVPGRGSRGVGVGLGKGRVDENERYEGDFGESGKAGGDFVKEVVGCENFGRGKEG